MTSTTTLTLTELQTSARTMGFRADIVNTGGNVMALSLTVHGADALVSLDWGQTSGTEWSVSLDAATREQYGEQDSGDLPVTSDADQTVRDAVAWINGQRTIPA